jgi:hypothetical protein
MENRSLVAGWDLAISVCISLPVSGVMECVWVLSSSIHQIKSRDSQIVSCGDWSWVGGVGWIVKGVMAGSWSISSSVRRSIFWKNSWGLCSLGGVGNVPVVSSQLVKLVRHWRSRGSLIWMAEIAARLESLWRFWVVRVDMAVQNVRWLCI